MTLPYELIRLVKFAGVLAFAGGAIAALITSDLANRRVAVHRVASPGLLVTWIGGYLLADALARPWTELWILAGFGGSFALQGILVWTVSIEARPSAAMRAAVIGLLGSLLVVMIWRPTWAMMGR